MDDDSSRDHLMEPLPRRLASQSRSLSPELVAEGVLRKARARVLLRIAIAMAGGAGSCAAPRDRVRRISLRTLCR